MKIKYLFLISLALGFNAFADEANPLDAKVVTYKDFKLNKGKEDYSTQQYEIKIVQTNVPELNRILEEKYCDSWDFQHDETIAECKKKGVRQTIEEQVKEIEKECNQSDDACRQSGGLRIFEQSYRYINTDKKTYFRVCQLDYNNGYLFGHQTLESCAFYDIENPKKPVLSDFNPYRFIDMEKIAIYFAEHGIQFGVNNHNKKTLSKQCKAIVNKEGRQYKYPEDRGEPIWQDNILAKCQSDTDKNYLKALSDYCCAMSEIANIEISKDKHSLHIDYYGHYGKLWSDWVEIDNDKTLEKLIPRDLWEVFMEK
ncbi:MAG: hypothetical protein IJR44_01800 [Neisseriaceae bacterium]|nr:hypothetical protein [Neisseriaceae bacterium]